MNAPQNLPIEFGQPGVVDLGEAAIGDSLKAACLECINAQKQAAKEARERFRPDDTAMEKVSPEALNLLLSNNVSVHGLATDRDLSNGIPFAAPHIAGSVNDPEVINRRRLIDKLMQEKVNSMFSTWKDLMASPSGLFWYPPGCCMGWHTNSKATGWRIYLNYAETEGKSFFRYRDPVTMQIVTLMDKQWNFRVFRVTDENPLWHCIYSNTNRFSIGYRVLEPSFKGALYKKLKKSIGLQG